MELISRAPSHHSAKFSEYVYASGIPNKPLSIVATILYGLILVAHTGQMIRYRAWYFSAVVVAGIMETLGYITRTISCNDVSSRGLFICQFALVVLAPVLVAAGDYIIFGKLLEQILGGPRARALGVPARWVTVIFITGDILSFILQGAGAGIMSSASNGQNARVLKHGQDIMVGGLGIQLVFFGFFSIATIRFDFKSRQILRERGEKYEKGARPKWRYLLWTLYASCVLIIMRSAYRVAEFSQGWTGFLASHERYFYGLEALPMLLALLLFVFIHPGQFLPEGRGKPSSTRSPSAADIEEDREMK